MAAETRYEGPSAAKRIDKQQGAAGLFLPWAFEWAWAPLIELVKLHRLGGHKAWIVACTVMMIVTLLIAATQFTAFMGMANEPLLVIE